MFICSQSRSKLAQVVQTLCLLCLILLTGCSHAAPTTTVLVPEATINGHPAHLDLDTGAAMTVIFNGSANKFGLSLLAPVTSEPPPQGAINLGITHPAKLAVGKQSITTPLLTYDTPWLVDLSLALLQRDGIIGWPEVRDNILLFDADHRTIRALDQLPPETSTWTKLRVRQDDILVLEIPQPDGTTAGLMIDTGSPFGIILNPDRWSQWRAANSKAPTSSEKYSMPGAGHLKVEEAWADHLRIGDLELTDLPVQAGQPIQFASPSHGIAMMGLYGLQRMDLIVDAHNGFAYVHPKPAPPASHGPFYPGFNRQGFSANDPIPDNDKWTMANNIRLNSDNLQKISDKATAILQEFSQQQTAKPTNDAK